MTDGDRNSTNELTFSNEMDLNEVGIFLFSNLMIMVSGGERIIDWSNRGSRGNAIWATFSLQRLWF